MSTLVKTGMLIRKPVAEVFEAFVDPEITKNFWFTKGSGRLESGAKVTWTWAMYDVSFPVDVHAVETNERIRIAWPGEHGPSTVEWRFTPHGDATFVEIAVSGLGGDAEDVLKQATDSAEGFALVLAGLKAFLEHGVRLNLVGDRFPSGIGG